MLPLALPTARKASQWLAGMAALFIADTAGDLGTSLGMEWYDIGMSAVGLAVGVFVAWRLPPRKMIPNKMMSTRNHLARALAAATLIAAVLIFELATLVPDDSALVGGHQLGTWQQVAVLVSAFIGSAWVWIALGALMWALPATNPLDAPSSLDHSADVLSWRNRRAILSSLRPTNPDDQPR